MKSWAATTYNTIKYLRMRIFLLDKCYSPKCIDDKRDCSIKFPLKTVLPKKNLIITLRKKSKIF